METQYLGRLSLYCNRTLSIFCCLIHLPVIHVAPCLSMCWCSLGACLYHVTKHVALWDHSCCMQTIVFYPMVRLHLLSSGLHAIVSIKIHSILFSIRNCFLEEMKKWFESNLDLKLLQPNWNITGLGAEVKSHTGVLVVSMCVYIYIYIYT